MAQKQKIG